jgi:hypothetical protein
VRSRHDSVDVSVGKDGVTTMIPFDDGGAREKVLISVGT